MMSAITGYSIPDSWIKYSPLEIVNELIEAKASVLSLQTIPYERNWVESLQKMELKREVAGTSRIEGADFTDQELDVALKESPEELITRSQRQAYAAMKTYKWIATIPDDKPIDENLILDIHRKIVTGADDDHCAPGKLRGADENVTFGTPRHRGAEGGRECIEAFTSFIQAIKNEYQRHDPFVQALAMHYHIAAMHPFQDGNGRTARALGALVLQRAGLRDTCFIAMSNYYYDEKNNYLKSLAETRAKNYDLTCILKFGLNGIKIQSQRLLLLIRSGVSKVLFRNMATHLFTKRISERKKVLADRQLNILNLLLDSDGGMFGEELILKTAESYKRLKSPRKALIRDIQYLAELQAIAFETKPDEGILFKVDLEWPTKITETEFFEKIKQLPKAKGYSFLR